MIDCCVFSCVLDKFWVQIGSNRVGSGRRVRRRARADLVFGVFDKFAGRLLVVLLFFFKRAVPLER